MEQDAVDAMVTRWAEQRPDLDVSSMKILSRIGLAHRLFIRLIEREYAKLGLNSAAFDVLAMLRQVGAPYRLTPTQLYTALGVSSGTMTNRIDQLEKGGLVRRIPDPHDRRGLLVELTPGGLEVINRLVAGHAAQGTLLVSALSGQERECLESGLRHLILALEHALQDDKKGASGSVSTGEIPPYMQHPGTRE